jgi:hypothetical protein
MLRAKRSDSRNDVEEPAKSRCLFNILCPESPDAVYLTRALVLPKQGAQGLWTTLRVIVGETIPVNPGATIYIGITASK